MSVYLKRFAWMFCFVAGFCFSQAAFSASESAIRMKEECSRVAGGKTADIQKQTMRECSGNQTDDLETSGSEDRRHAKLKACDAEAKGMKESAKADFLKKCYTKKK